MTRVWKLQAGHTDPGNHPTITESTTGIVACGDSWCDGSCGLPALVMTHGRKEYRAFGAMVAMGSVFQDFRRPWIGSKIEVTTDVESYDVLLRRFWM